jgi:hypothetical protein
MKKLAGNLEPHALSEVLTGAMFDILMGVFRQAPEKRGSSRWKAGRSSKPSDRRALADTVPRMQMLAIQPLDLLPPCAVTFRDYALASAACRAGRQSDRPVGLSPVDDRLLHQARHSSKRRTASR